MLPGATLQPGIDFQADAPRRCGFGAPRRHDEEFLAGQHWRPRILSRTHPIHISRPARLAEPLRAFRLAKERLYEPVAFDDAQRSGLPQIREQAVAVLGLHFNSNGIHQWTNSMLSAF